MTADSVSPIPGVANFRDIGGLPAGSSRTRSGVLFRSGNLAHLPPAGVDALRELGIRRIVDLRDADELEYAPSRVDGLGAETLHVPLFLGSVASFFERDMSLAAMYRMMIDEFAAGVVGAVRGMAGAQPVLIHCTVGKDRTGVTVALALAAAGADIDAVVADYARTETMLPAWRNREIVQRLRAMHPEAVHLEDLATRSPAPVMAGLLTEVGERYGSAAGYLRAHGLSDDDLAALRAALVE